MAAFTPQTRYKLQEVLFIIIYWIAFANLYILIRYVGSEYNPAPGAVEEVANIKNIVLLASLGGGLMGLLVGFFEIFLYPKFLKKMSFGYSILYRTVSFVVIVILAIATVSLIFYSGHGYSVTQTVEFSIIYFKSSSFISLFVYLIVVSAIMDFILQVNQRFGPGVIHNMLRGKYHHPREEDRIFMFLDLQSSSQIAEDIGHLNFSYFLQDCFRDLSDVLLKYEASVYQFVGDEAVLTWHSRHGLKNANCINIFFEFDSLLTKKSHYYLSKYNRTPVFKSAVNMGKVTVAEVGKIKSEIAYHGDVLNTASRVQGLCNSYNEKILITEPIMQGLNSNSTLTTQFIADVALKGKEKKEKIYSVSKNGL